jgi:undecaprenyl-diphosphatase
MTTILTWDTNILLFIQAFQADWLTELCRFASFLGGKGCFWVILSIFLLCRRSTRRMGYTLAAALIIEAVLTNGILKPLIARPRPYQAIPGFDPLSHNADGMSFPSGHTGSAFAAWFALRPQISYEKSLALFLFSSLIAFSRLYLGVHYPTDIIGGIAIGYLSSWLATLFLQYVLSRNSRCPLNLRTGVKNRRA